MRGQLVVERTTTEMERAVLQSSPAKLECCFNRVTGQRVTQRRRSALVKENTHLSDCHRAAGSVLQHRSHLSH